VDGSANCELRAAVCSREGLADSSTCLIFHEAAVHSKLFEQVNLLLIIVAIRFIIHSPDGHLQVQSSHHSRSLLTNSGLVLLTRRKTR